MSNSNLARPALVVRTAVVRPVTHYREFRDELRVDFWFACAYCAIAEIEAQGLRFTVDHYEPQSKKNRALVNKYSNLFWACDDCNQYKGDLDPPPEAREAGHRFLRIDVEDPRDHLRLDGVMLEALTTVGEFNREMLDLNRKSLRRVREYRQRFFDAQEEVLLGLRALQGLSIDQVRPDWKRRINQMRQTLVNRLDALREYTEESMEGFVLSVARRKFTSLFL